MSKTAKKSSTANAKSKRRKGNRRSGLSGFGNAVNKMTNGIPSYISKPAGFILGLAVARGAGMVVDKVLKVDYADEKFSIKKLANPATQLAVATGLYLTRKHTGEIGECAAYGAGVSGAVKAIGTYVPAVPKFLGLGMLGESEFDGLEATFTAAEQAAAARVLAAHNSEYMPDLPSREVAGLLGDPDEIGDPELDGGDYGQYRKPKPLWMLQSEMDKAEEETPSYEIV